MADVPEHVKKQLEENRKVSEASKREFEERSVGKPTPTQEENDRAKLGEHLMEKEEDGSPKEGEVKTRAVEAQRPGTYATRSTRATPSST
jgi:hypothetical protein